jgi:hypothetical protein
MNKYDMPTTPNALRQSTRVIGDYQMVTRETTDLYRKDVL